jgi:hypothetical protein
MADPAGSLTRRAAAAACLWLLFAAHALAQSPLPLPAPPPASPEFMPRANFYVSAAALQVDDPRFTWDTRFGGDVDIVDYVFGRVNGLAEYEAVLGNQFRLFDPNQGNYVLEFSASGRVRSTEIAGVFHHESRHLSDRPKRPAVAWNVLGVRVLRRLDLSGATIDVQGGLGRVIEHAFVDYSWTGDLDIVVRRAINPRVGLFAHGTGEIYGIDGSESARHSQTQGRVEVGLRVNGPAAAGELFVGFERRIDAYPLDREGRRWVLAGFRIITR